MWGRAIVAIACLYVAAFATFALIGVTPAVRFLARYDPRVWREGGDAGSVSPEQLYALLRANGRLGERPFYMHAAFDWRADELVVYRVSPDRIERLAAFPLPTGTYLRLRGDEALLRRYERNEPLRLRDAADAITSARAAELARDDFCLGGDDAKKKGDTAADTSWPNVTVSNGGRDVRYTVGDAELRLSLPLDVVARVIDEPGFVHLAKQSPCATATTDGRAPVRYGDYVAYYLRRYDPTVRPIPRGTERYDRLLPYFEWKCASTGDDSPSLRPTTDERDSDDHCERRRCIVTTDA